MGVKNTFCATYAETNIEDKSRNHEYFKNQKSSVGSLAMDAVIIVNELKKVKECMGLDTTN